MAADQLREECEVQHGGRAASRAVGTLTPVAHEVEAEFTVGRLGRSVRFPTGNLEAAVAHRQLEVGDRALDRGVDLLLGRQGRPLVDADVYGAGGDVFERLRHDLEALPHLGHPHEVAGIAVAGRRAADLEVEVFVGEVGLVLAEVAGDTAGAGHGAGGSAIDRFLFREHAHALRAIDEDAIAGEQPLHVFERLGEGLHEGADLFDHQRREVLRDAADAGPTVGEPRAAEGLEDVVDHLALIERVEEEGERTGVETDSAVGEQVVADPGQLGDDRADRPATGRQVDAQQFLHGVMPGHVVGHRGDVVHAIGDRHVLVEREVLAELLEARVQVAHFRHRVDNPLAVEFEHQPERGVGGGMLGAEVERPEVVLRPLGRGIGGRIAAERSWGWGDGHGWLAVASCGRG